MATKKFILALVMLLSYSTTIAHEIIPHCHHDASQVGARHNEDHHDHHENHHHDERNSEEHSHSADCVESTDDLLCYLICLLSEAEHPEQNDNNCAVIPATQSKLSTKSEFQSTKLKCVTQNISLDGLSRTLYPLADSGCLCTVDHFASIQRRGPPETSC